MAEGSNGIRAGRLEQSAYRENFDDLHPPLGAHEALVEAERCYFCYDAPCVTACPTKIDIPLFIRQIATGNPIGSAETIFSQNIMGGMCARVCPTETLCEEVCVREEAEGKPVKIGHLQRFATDLAMTQDRQFSEREKSSGKKIAVVGAGPAGLACAHRLAIYGHDVKVFDARQKPGGLNEYGIASYKTIDNFAQREVDYITAIGGIEIVNGKALGEELSFEALKKDFDAIFLGLGLGATGALGIDGENSNGVEDAIDFIEKLRQAKDVAKLPVGRKIVIIGGGMTAIDAGVQAKFLGAQEVTICYRRGKAQMAASRYEQELATANGVMIRHWLQPVKVENTDNTISAVKFETTSDNDGKLSSTGETLVIEADQLFLAIGQKLDMSPISPARLEMQANRIKIDENGRTSDRNIWAGGDCAIGGDDLTVSAVAMGRDAAEDIHATLNKGEG